MLLSSLFPKSFPHPELFSSVQVPKSPWPASPWVIWESTPEQGSPSPECTHNNNTHRLWRPQDQPGTGPRASHE